LIAKKNMIIKIEKKKHMLCFVALKCDKNLSVM